MTDKRHDVDPGPHATPEQRQKTRKEVFKIIEAVKQFHTPFAADYIRRNPPSAEAIATLAFYGYEMLSAEHGRKGGKATKYNQALQEVVNMLVSQLINKGETPTLASVLNNININQSSDKILNCEIEIEDDMLVCTNYDGTEKYLAKRSLEPYIKRAKETL